MNKNRLLGGLLPIMATILTMVACNRTDVDIDDHTMKEEAKTIPYTVTVGSGEPSTRATVDGDNKTLRFAEGDKLYVTGRKNSGEMVCGVLSIQTGVGETSATFSGNLNHTGGVGSPADDFELNATLVSDQQTSDAEVSINSTTYAVRVNYPHDAFCESVNAAVQQYSCLTGTSTFGARSFSLSQQTAFLNFVITFEDGTAAGETLSVLVNNIDTEPCTGSVTTVAESDKVVAKFVLPIDNGPLAGGATVKLGTKAALTINSESVNLKGKVYNVKRTQLPKTVADITAEDLHKFISADGKIYETQAAATRQGATTVARICYVGSDAETNETYNHGLALALTDANNGEIAVWCTLDDTFWINGHTCLPNHYLNSEDALRDMAGIANTDALVALNGIEVTAPTIEASQPTITKPHEHVAAMAARNFKYATGIEAGAHPAGTSAWFLPSAGQWRKMIDAAGLPDLVGGGHYGVLRDMMALHGEDDSVYWTSTERIHNNGCCYDAWYQSFDSKGFFSYDFKKRGGYYNNYVRSALAF